MTIPLLEVAPEKRMIVYAPHADDEVLGAGGLMARASACGWQVHVHLATVSGYPSMPRQEASTNAGRLTELQDALRTVGAAGHEVLYFGRKMICGSTLCRRLKSLASWNAV